MDDTQQLLKEVDDLTASSKKTSKKKSGNNDKSQLNTMTAEVHTCIIKYANYFPLHCSWLIHSNC